MTFVRKAYAKVNFTLELLGKRPDGYHNLRSLVVPVSLADELEIDPFASKTECILAPDGTVAAGILAGEAPEKNLAVKAVRLMQELTGEKREARIVLHKHIPLGGGLGGGSADAATVLRTLNDAWKCGFSLAELAAYSAQIGSDIPSLVLGGAVLMEGRGETVHPFAVEHFNLPLVIANPLVHSSTKEVFAHSSISRLPEEGGIVYNMEQALRLGDSRAVAEALQNDLEEASCALHGSVARALEFLRTSGALGASLSGSGASVFAIASSSENAGEIASRAREEGLAAWVAHTCPVM